MRLFSFAPSVSACAGFLALLAITIAPASAAVIQTFDFETGDLSQLNSREPSTADLAVSTTVARRGTYSMRCTLAAGQARSEGVSSLRGTVGGVNWYGWSIYVPANYPGDGLYDIVSQFHDWHRNLPTWSDTGRAPTCFTFDNGRIGFGLKYQSAPSTAAHKYFDLAPITNGAWHDIVMHVRWTHLNTGFMKIWINGALKLDYTGPTYMDYGSGNGPYFKWGNYKGTSNWQGTAPRVFYMDEYRMGNASSSYAEVSPLPLAASESFNYTQGTLVGANGGFGWTAGWTSSGGAGSATVLSPGSTYTGLPAVGGRFQIFDTDGVHQQVSRTLAKTFGAATETYWLSFLARKFNSGREATINFGGLSFHATSGNWMVKTPATSYTAIPGAAYSALNFFLVRVDAGATSDTVRVWVNPSIAAGEPATGTAAVALTDTPGFSFSTVAIKHGPWGNSSQSGEYDEIRLGGNFKAVTEGPTPGVSFTMDNLDATGVTITGAWSLSSYSPGYYLDNYLHDGNTGATGGKSVRFTPNLPFSGSYEVFARWTSDANRASNAPIDIAHAGGTAYLEADQQTGGSTWVSLGTYNFSLGSTGSVLIHNDGANGNVIVDGLRFTAH